MASGTHIQPASPDAFANDASTTKETSASSCCGGPAPTGTKACCARDAEVKSTGGIGCGCSPATAVPAKKSGCCG